MLFYFKKWTIVFFPFRRPFFSLMSMTLMSIATNWSYWSMCSATRITISKCDLGSHALSTSTYIQPIFISIQNKMPMLGAITKSHTRFGVQRFAIRTSRKFYTMSYYVLHICQLQFYYINTYFQRFSTIIFVRNIHSSIHCRTFTLNNTWNIKRPNKQTWNKHWECTNASTWYAHTYSVFYKMCGCKSEKNILSLSLFHVLLVTDCVGCCTHDAFEIRALQSPREEYLNQNE